MTIKIPDDVLEATGLSEQDMLVELACHLFDKGKLDLWPAARMAGLSRTEFESACLERKIPVYRVTMEDFEHDMKVLDKLKPESQF